MLAGVIKVDDLHRSREQQVMYLGQEIRSGPEPHQDRLNWSDAWFATRGPRRADILSEKLGERPVLAAWGLGSHA